MRARTYGISCDIRSEILVQQNRIASDNRYVKFPDKAGSIFARTRKRLRNEDAWTVRMMLKDGSVSRASTVDSEVESTW